MKAVQSYVETGYSRDGAIVFVVVSYIVIITPIGLHTTLTSLFSVS
jgi:hypothetical protein